MLIRIPRTVYLLIAIIAVGIVYYTFNPYGYSFPRCPVNSLLHIKCPSCGSQRAIHFLLHGQVYDAMKENVLSVLVLPYVLLAWYARQQQKPGRLVAFGKWLYSRTAIHILLTIIAVFTLYRNIVH